MFGVHRAEFGAECSSGIEGGTHGRPADDQRLLVRDGDTLPGAQGGNRRGERREPAGSDEDDIDVITDGHHIERLPGGGGFGAQRVGVAAGTCEEGGRGELACLVVQQARVAACGECDHLEGIGQRAHDIERLLADGTGGAEDREPDHGMPALVAMTSARRWGATAIAQTSIGRRRR